MMTRGMFGLAACIVAALGVNAAARAEAFKDKGGHAVFIPMSIESTKQADGSTVLKVSSTGISTTDLPFPFDYMKSQCSGTVLIGADGKPGRSRGICEVLSTKGDRAVYFTVGDASAGRATWIEGAGAYAGIKGMTSYKTKATMPGGGVVYEWTGSWQTD